MHFVYHLQPVGMNKEGLSVPSATSSVVEHTLSDSPKGTQRKWRGDRMDVSAEVCETEEQ